MDQVASSSASVPLRYRLLVASNSIAAPATLLATGQPLLAVVQRLLFIEPGPRAPGLPAFPAARPDRVTHGEGRADHAQHPGQEKDRAARIAVHRTERTP